MDSGKRFLKTVHFWKLIALFTEDGPDFSIYGNTGMLPFTVEWEFKSGFSGTIFSACFLKTDFARVSLEIFCSKVMLEYDAVLAKIRVTRQEGVEEIKATNDPYLLEDKTFIEAIKREDSSLIRSSITTR